MEKPGYIAIEELCEQLATTVQHILKWASDYHGEEKIVDGYIPLEIVDRIRYCHLRDTHPDIAKVIFRPRRGTRYCSTIAHIKRGIF